MDRPTVQISRFRNIPEAVMRRIIASPEFRRHDFQEMLRRDQVEIRFQKSADGRGDIVTHGKTPTKYVADGFLKAALVESGLSGSALIPQDETALLFSNFMESDN